MSLDWHHHILFSAFILVWSVYFSSPPSVLAPGVLTVRCSLSTRVIWQTFRPLLPFLWFLFIHFLNLTHGAAYRVPSKEQRMQINIMSRIISWRPLTRLHSVFGCAITGHSNVLSQRRFCVQSQFHQLTWFFKGDSLSSSRNAQIWNLVTNQVKN